MLDITQYQDELLTTASRIVKEPTLAKDMVQETFLKALEEGIDQKEQLLEIVTKLSLKLYGERKRGPDACQSGFYHSDDAGKEDPVWRKLSSPEPRLDKYDKEEISQALRIAGRQLEGYISFKDAREYARSFNLRSHKEWKAHKLDNPHIPIPDNPKLIYGDQWEGWQDFLGSRFYSYDEFINYVRTVLLPMGIDTQAKFKTALSSLPKFIPTNPNIVYKGQWPGWGPVLESERKRPSELLSYEAAKKYVQDSLIGLGIDTLKIWQKRRNEIPDFLPACPDQYYRNRGWINSADFFGTDKAPVCFKRTFLPYKEAKEWVRLNLRPAGINTSEIYMDFMCGKLTDPTLPAVPTNIPVAPASYYKDSGFSWGDYLGTLRIGVSKVIRYDYAECKVWIARNLNGRIKSSDEWLKYVNGKYGDLPGRPEKVPKHPYRRYMLTKEWISWEDFLGIVIVRRAKVITKEDRSRLKGRTSGILSYERARQYMIEYMVPKGIVTLEQYEQLPEKPITLPADPRKHYKGKGWISADHFMGMEDGKRYLSYEDAKIWVKENLLPKGVDSIYKYRKVASELPYFMPFNPHHFYKNKGWIDGYDFMGTSSRRIEGRAQGRVDFMTFEEARKWIKMNIPSVNTYHKWRAYVAGEIAGLPALPPNIPRVPDVTYPRIDEWKGWPIFLSNGTTRGRPKKELIRA